MNSNIAQQISFWKLINMPCDNGSRLEIVVPDLQRDYAEGRKDKETTQIRTNLIRQICDSLKQKGEKGLNFIYGTLNGNCFIPIDGQQRLTTLFLLHWYVFIHSERFKGKISELERFAYQTRTTTKDFCRELCLIEKLDTTAKTSACIKNMNWFSGNISLDPSVKSMLVVLDDIERELQGADFDGLSEYLVDDSCGIDFLWFDVGNFNPEDLYIKMNSRGKHLTDFESFKAKLQPSVYDKTVLSDVFESDEAAIEFIGRINNDYTNIFYRHCGSDSFDTAMMNFFISVIKCDQFAYIGSLEGLNAKDYREIFNSSDLGSVFYEKFINNPVKQWKELNLKKKRNVYDIVDESALRERLKHSFLKIDFVLSAINSNTFDFDKNSITDRKHAEYTVPSLIRSNGTSHFKEQLRQYAIFEYLFRMKPECDEDLYNFVMWKRFVSNVLENAVDSKGSGFSDTADACETIYFINCIIDHICTHIKEYGINRLILEACGSYSEKRSGNGSREGFPPSILFQMKEELKKLELMSKDDEWFKIITEAENYYYDGQIRFLFDCPEDSDSIGAFKECFDLSKRIFTAEKSVNIENVKWHKLQRAALCCEDNTDDRMSYMVHKTNWRFYTPDLSYKKMLANGSLKPVFDACRGKDDLDAAMDSIPVRDFEECESWKAPFADRLLEDMVEYNASDANTAKFSFTIAFREDTVLLLSGEYRTSAPGMELNTFKLCLDLPHEDKRMVFAKGDRICDEEGVPLRYVDVGGKQIGWSSVEGCFVNVKDISQKYGSVEEIIDILS